jgi:hypothetical protein
VASRLHCKAVRFISDLDSKVDYLYGLLSELIDFFCSSAHRQSRKVGFFVGNQTLDGYRYRFEQAVAERNRAYEIWRGNVNKIKGDRNWLAFAEYLGLQRAYWIHAVLLLSQLIWISWVLLMDQKSRGGGRCEKNESIFCEAKFAPE